MATATHPGDTASLQARLEQPDTLAALHMLLDQLPELVTFTRMAAAFLQRGPELAENANDMIQLARTAADQNGQTLLPKLDWEQLRDKAQRTAEVLNALQEPLTDPETVNSLHTLIEHLPNLAQFVVAVDQLLRRGPEISDNLSDLFELFLRSGQGRDASGVTLRELASRLAEIAGSEQLKAILRSKALSPEAVGVVDEVASAMIEARDHVRREDIRVGAWGVLKAAGDPEVQRGLGFLIEIARNLGRTHHAEHA